MGNPSYLVRQPSSYCFRMVVPSDLQGLVGKRALFGILFGLVFFRGEVWGAPHGGVHSGTI